MHTKGFFKQLLEPIKNGEETRSNASRFCPCSGDRSSSYSQRSGLRVEDSSIELNERMWHIWWTRQHRHQPAGTIFLQGFAVVAGLELLAEYDRMISSDSDGQVHAVLHGCHTRKHCTLVDVGANVILETGTRWRLVQEAKQPQAPLCWAHIHMGRNKQGETADDRVKCVYEPEHQRVAFREELRSRQALFRI